MADERTERPTEYRRRRMRERGLVAYSRDLTAAAALLGAFAALKTLTPWLISKLEAATTQFLIAASGAEVNVDTVGVYGQYAMSMFAVLAAPPLLAAALAALAVGWAQTGFLFSLYPLIPSAEKISPVAGLRRLFSWQGLFETVKSVAKLSIILLIAWLTLRTKAQMLYLLGLEPPLCAARRMVDVATALTLRCGLGMLLIAAADYCFQFWQTERRLMMTRHEWREEWKETEGDPFIEARRRQRRRELLQQLITPEMREASVVVTNPVHLAVALRYVLGEMPAPKVVAKGRGPVAERILAIARTYNIPVVEDVAVARALFGSVAVGDYIPRALYQAVAEILAAVYRQRMKRGEARSGPRGL